jgi:hypothetical protein
LETNAMMHERRLFSGSLAVPSRPATRAFVLGHVLLALTLGCGGTEDPQSAPEGSGSAEHEVNGGRACRVFVVSDIDAMRAWNEVLNGEAVERDFRVAGLIRGTNDYDPWIRLSIDESPVAYSAQTDGRMSAMISGDTATRLFDAMNRAEERTSGDSTLRTSKDGMLECWRTGSGRDAQDECHWNNLPALFSVEPASGNGCP